MDLESTLAMEANVPSDSKCTVYYHAARSNSELNLAGPTYDFESAK